MEISISVKDDELKLGIDKLAEICGRRALLSIAAKLDKD